MTESEYLKKCLQLIEQKMAWAESTCWTRKNFEILSKKISESSKIFISYQTLRRLYGRIKTEEKYSPQLETKNALAIFLQYKDWENFKENVVISSAHENFERLAYPSSTPKLSETDTTKVRKTNLMPFALTFAGLLAILFYYRWKNNSGTSNYHMPQFSFTGKLTNGTAPFTVVFNYDVSKIATDSIFVDFDSYLTKRSLVNPLDKRSHILTTSYTCPGFYRVKLKAGNQILATENVQVNSRGWEAVIYDNSKLYFIVDQHKLTQLGRMYIAPKDVNKYAIYARPVDISDRVDFINVMNYPANGDKFSFETRLRNNPKEGGIFCYDAICTLSGDKGDISVKFVNKGCEGWSFVNFGDVKWAGRQSDLLKFGQDLSKDGIIKIRTYHKTGYIYYNNTLIKQVPYHSEIGQIKAIAFQFRGYGSVDYVKLFDNNKLVYNEEFNEKP